MIAKQRSTSGPEPLSPPAGDWLATGNWPAATGSQLLATACLSSAANSANRASSADFCIQKSAILAKNGP
jgi:hypothetical protein